MLPDPGAHVTNFPADHELIAFFEAEPNVLDPGVPWTYNTLNFETERQGTLVQCRIAPAYGDIDVRLTQPSGAELARAKLEGFKSFSLIVDTHREALIATSDGDPTMLCLVLKPRLWLGVDNFQGIPF
jgi:hypothetical protein